MNELNHKLLVLAGPTAVGKGTVVREILAHNPQVVLSVSATTRAPRAGEIDGTSYFFLNDAEFDSLIANNQMLEWATVHGQHRYGTPREPVELALNQGKAVLLEIDIQGARQVKKSMPSATSVFLAPPSWPELVRRLEGRGTETPEQMAKRLDTAKIELSAQAEFDHVIVNDDVAKCAAAVVDLMMS